MKLVKLDAGWINPFEVSVLLSANSCGVSKTKIYMKGMESYFVVHLPIDEVAAIINGGLK